MTVILHDARQNMTGKGFDRQSAIDTEVLYADDTLLIHVFEKFLAAWMQEIERGGKR